MMTTTTSPTSATDMGAWLPPRWLSHRVTARDATASTPTAPTSSRLVRTVMDSWWQRNQGPASGQTPIEVPGPLRRVGSGLAATVDP